MSYLKQDLDPACPFYLTRKQIAYSHLFSHFLSQGYIKSLDHRYLHELPFQQELLLPILLHSLVLPVLNNHHRLFLLKYLMVLILPLLKQKYYHLIFNIIFNANLIFSINDFLSFVQYMNLIQHLLLE